MGFIVFCVLTAGFFVGAITWIVAFVLSEPRR